MRDPRQIRLRNIAIQIVLIVLSIGMTLALYQIWQIKQDVDEAAHRLSLDYGPQTTVIYDSKDRIISALYKEHRLPVMLEQMSDPLVNAVITAEDRRFYEHNGIDLRRIAAAMV